MAVTRYSEEFKRDAVGLVMSSGRSTNSVAKELGVNTESLRKWVLQARGAAGGRAGDVMTPDERAELKRLRRQVRELKLEKEILRKAAQWLRRR
ncbi:transposase [Streptomyces sp. NPDC058394]|uniref:transposase n=1 Tax=Streptomyces sp. NPDC058394 TaxID=3346477 RepID=UPI003649D05F